MYQCVYKEVSGTKKCIKQEMNCEYYSGQDGNYCASIKINNYKKYRF